MAVTPRQLACFALFEAERYPPESAGAWVGNWTQEVGVNIPTAFRHGPLDHSSQAGPQWRDSKSDKRLTHYEDYVIGLHPELVHPGMTRAQVDAAMWDLYGRMDYQVKYCAIECRAHFPHVEAALRQGGDIDTLTDLITWHFEIPAAATARADYRRAQARAVFAAAAHIGTSPATQANIAKTQAQAKVKVNNTNAGGGLVLGAVIGLLHWIGGMPSELMWAAGAGVAFLVVYSLYAAQKAAAVAGVAGAKAASSTKPVEAPAPLPEVPKPEIEVPEMPFRPDLIPEPENLIPEPAIPILPPQWVWNAREGYWYFGEPRPVVKRPDPPPQPSHPLMSDDIDDIVNRIVKALDTTIAEDFKLKV